MIQQRKQNCVNRLLAHGDVWTQLAVQGLCTRDHLARFTPPDLSVLTPQSIRPGYWVSSLLSYGFQANTGHNKPIRSKPRAALSELFDSLTGNILNSLRSTKAQHAFLGDRHLSSYADMVA